jgi:uncharacterized protein (DUF2235 family)
MPRKCSVCGNSRVEEINKCLVKGETIRNIAKQFSISPASVNRHKDHLPQTLIKSQEVVEAVKATSVLSELQKCFTRVNKLFDACDEWLRDVDDPEKYNLDPRASDVSIIYSEEGPDGKPIRRKATMSRLLAEIRGAGYMIESWETKHADPRELILKTAGRLAGQIEILAKLILLMDQEKRLEALEKAVSNQNEGDDY